MSYLFIDYNAVCSIAQDTLYQSTDYVQGKKIIELIKNKTTSSTKKIHLFSCDAQLYITGKDIDKQRFILFDLKKLNLYLN